MAAKGHCSHPTKLPDRHAPGDASPHASVSGSGSESVSTTHREEPGPDPMHLGSLAPSRGVAPGPEGRQMIAQRVSAGFRPRMVSQPQRGDRNPFPCPLLPVTHSHAETPRPPRLEDPSSRLSWVRVEALLKRETKAQESGNKVAAIHRLLPAVVQLTVQLIRTFRNGIALRMRWMAALAPL
jgi:hypothetical protein